MAGSGPGGIVVFCVFVAVAVTLRVLAGPPTSSGDGGGDGGDGGGSDGGDCGGDGGCD